ncbi:MAG: glycerol kinase GlpK, partial [Spirochaetota bacterium]
MAGKERYVLALDQGTTSSRAILFNHSGVVIGSKQLPFEQIFPRPGWVEHDPEAIWSSQYEAALGAIASAQIEATQIDCIGISNQRETTLVWERSSGKPVHNAIVWQCRRSASICRELREAGHSGLVARKTGLLLDPYFSGTKLMWLFAEHPELRARAARGELLFGTVDSWLVWRLTGLHRTDPMNASRTLLFNIREGRWDEELLSLFGIPQAMLPEVVPSSSAAGYGRTKKELFGVEIPVTGVAGDQQAALFGHACFDPRDAKNTYGTGCFALMNTGSFPVASAQNLLTTVAWDLGPGAGKGYTYALEGSVFVAGAVIQWLRDQLGLIADAAESEALALSVPDSGEVVLVPAFVGLGAPHWDSEARGTIVGLTRGSSRAHIVRAALESIAFQSRDLLVAMEKDFGRPLLSIKADGGASANSFLMQFQADIAGRRVVLPEVAETTALGAAYLAGIASGY